MHYGAIEMAVYSYSAAKEIHTEELVVLLKICLVFMRTVTCKNVQATASPSPHETTPRREA